MPAGPHPEDDLIPEHVVLGGVALDVCRPRDLESLIDDDAFGAQEFLPYWAELWPSTPVLAEALGAVDLDGLRILELGCGLGLPSLVAAHRGARVTATDWAADALALLAGNAERNGLDLDLRRLDWFAPADAWPDGPPEPWPLVVAADVLYEARNGPALLRTLERVVAPGGEAWIADPGRPTAAGFWRAAAETWTLDLLGDEASGRPTVRRLRRRD
ncbi:class I SAM-dependent methyltransferase [Patulibacter minatonensis]|uniref:class I SAM-dependent methyltransferase n=1 Tax=Patulibacter minatonensis TaxID=298163 RepID=UPI00068777DF|nr:methyltransferase domain-containing protein [Patulibacter minatonensis]